MQIYLDNSPLFPFFKDILDGFTGHNKIEIDSEYTLITECDEDPERIIWGSYEIRLVHNKTNKIIQISDYVSVTAGLTYIPAYVCISYIYEIEHNIFPDGLMRVNHTKLPATNKDYYQVMSVLYSLRKKGKL